MDTITGITNSIHHNTTMDSMSENTNATAKCPKSNPTFLQYMSAMDSTELIVNSVMTVLVILVIVIFVDELLFLYKKSSRRLQRHKAKWLLGIYPVIALTSYISLLAPRSSGLNDMVASMIVALCVYVFVVMVIEEYGGPKRMMARLNGTPLNVVMLRPWCFCFKCFPIMKVTNTTLQVLHALIFQYVVVRPFLGYIITIMWVDGSFGQSTQGDSETKPPIQAILGYIASFSSIMAIWSFAMLYQLCRIPLGNLHIQGKFICLQLVLLITGIQRSIISLFVIGGLITCSTELTSIGAADRWNHLIIICEMLVLAFFARKLYRNSMLKRIKLMDQAMASEETLDSEQTIVERESCQDEEC